MTVQSDYRDSLRTLLEAAPRREAALRHVSQQLAASDRSATEDRNRLVAESERRRSVPMATLREAEELVATVRAAPPGPTTGLLELRSAELSAHIGHAHAEWQHLDALERHVDDIERSYLNRKAGARAGTISRYVVLGAAGLVTLGILATMMPYAIGM